MPDPKVTIIAEDGVKVHPGDRVYNYYDMEPGTISTETQYFTVYNNAENLNRDIWFEFKSSRGTTILNGERICSMRYARRRGFKDADE